MKKYEIHKDLKRKPIAGLLLLLLQKIFKSIVLNRLWLPVLQKSGKNMFDKIKINKQIEQRKIMISGYNQREITIEIFSPQNIKEPAPCLIFIHGGGFALNALHIHKKMINDYVIKTPCKVLLIDYGLTPKHPYPYALEDCYSTLQWTLKNYSRLGIDKNRIGLYGDSAGGNLSAALTHLIRDRMGQKLLFQVLIYPVTDSRLKTESMNKYDDTPIWDSKLTKKMWKLYLPGRDYSLDIKYSSPNTLEDFSDLPQCYLEVAEFDCLRDEGIEYYEKLKRNGINAVLNKTAGTFHAFEFNYTSKYTQNILEERIKYMKEKFYSEKEV